MRDDIDDYLPVVFKKLSWLTREELITRVVALNFNRFLDYYKDAKDLNIDEDKKDKRSADKKDKKVHDDSHMVRLFFGLGKRDHIKPNSLIGRINDVTGTKDIEIGHIDLMENFSFVAVDGAKAKFIVDCFADPTKNKEGIRVEITTGDPKDNSDKKEKKSKSVISTGAKRSGEISSKKEKKSRDSFHEERRRRDREEEKHERRSRDKDKKDKRFADKKDKRDKKKRAKENERPERKHGKRVRY